MGACSFTNGLRFPRAALADPGSVLTRSQAEVAHASSCLPKDFYRALGRRLDAGFARSEDFPVAYVGNSDGSPARDPVSIVADVTFS
jgi:hypothetical protein